MRILVGSLVQESNTLSPVTSDLSTFRDGLLVYGEESVEGDSGPRNELNGFLDVLKETDAEIVPTLSAWASSGGPLTDAAAGEIVGTLLEMAASAGPVDGALIALHGSLAAEGNPDVDGWILSELKRILGPDIPLVVSLDMHANVTEAMLSGADSIIGYDTYPHLDMFETGRRAARLLLKILEGDALPTMAVCRLPLLLSPHSASTFDEPLRSVAEARDDLRESEGVLSTSVFTVQPWLDVPELGSTVVIVAESGREREAVEKAASLGDKLWKAREAFDVPLLTPEEAVERAVEIEGTVLLVDPADAVSAGSPGDGTAVLRALLDADLPGPALVSLVDPVAARVAYESNGRSIELEAGGALDPSRNAPVRLRGTSRRVENSRVAYSSGVGDGLSSDLGRAAVITVGGVHVLLTEKSVSCYDPSLYRVAGLEPERARIIVVKSPSNFKWTYRDIADEILYVNAPGASPPRLGDVEFTTAPRSLYPLDEVEGFVPEGRMC